MNLATDTFSSQHQMTRFEHCNVSTPFVTSLVMINGKPSEALWVSFGQWLKSQRSISGLTQHEAAAKAGIDRQQWYRIESGNSGSKRDTVIALAEAVGADVNDALRRAGYSASPANGEGSLNLEIDENVRVSMLHGKNLSETDREKFRQAFKVAYRIAKDQITETEKEAE